MCFDAAIPLVNILDKARTESLTPKIAAESTQQALKFIGNILAHLSLSVEQCQKTATCLNKELSTFVDEKDIFTDAAPFLFGSVKDEGSHGGL